MVVLKGTNIRMGTFEKAEVNLSKNQEFRIFPKKNIIGIFFFLFLFKYLIYILYDFHLFLFII